MRYFTFCILAITLAFAAPPAPAALADEAEVTRPLTKDGRLDKLFDELKKARNAVEAGDITKQIWAEWNDSGSPTVNLILKWAQEATNKRNYTAALDFLDQATSLMPDNAESWNKRATLHFRMGNYKKSMTDVTRVLALEPRHFGALSGMAIILESRGKDEQALAVWKRVLEVYPGDRKAQKRVIEISEELAGNRT